MSEFTLLLEQEIPRLRRYVRALRRDRLEADDLVQDCLVRALAKQHLWRSGTDLRAWLFTILHNLHINEVRRSVREENRIADAGEFLRPAPADPAARLALLELDQAIGKLPENQRQVVLLIDLEDMDYDQAAAILGVPTGTVRSRLARARDTLRRRLDREAGSGLSAEPCPVRSRLAAAAALHG